jgi:hypothetical protein
MISVLIDESLCMFPLFTVALGERQRLQTNLLKRKNGKILATRLKVVGEIVA